MQRFVWTSKIGYTIFPKLPICSLFANHPKIRVEVVMLYTRIATQAVALAAVGGLLTLEQMSPTGIGSPVGLNIVSPAKISNSLALCDGLT